MSVCNRSRIQIGRRSRDWRTWVGACASIAITRKGVMGNRACGGRLAGVSCIVHAVMRFTVKKHGNFALLRFRFS